MPAGKLVHVILDNYGTHKHPKVMAWLNRHPRWTFHYTGLVQDTYKKWSQGLLEG